MAVGSFRLLGLAVDEYNKKHKLKPSDEGYLSCEKHFEDKQMFRLRQVLKAKSPIPNILADGTLKSCFEKIEELG